MFWRVIQNGKNREKKKELEEVIQDRDNHQRIIGRGSSMENEEVGEKN